MPIDQLSTVSTAASQIRYYIRVQTDNIMNQLEFYNEYKDQVQKFGILNVFEDREDRIAFRDAERAILGARSFKNPKKTWSGVKATTKKRNVQPWTMEELDFLADLYLQHADPVSKSDSRELIVSEFRKKFDTHSDDAVEITIRSFVSADSQYDSLGRAVCPRYYDLLNSKCPDRFVMM